jgi:hypothetical protein
VKILEPAAAVIVVFLVVAQAFRIHKSNPPVESDINAPTQVKEVMRLRATAVIPTRLCGRGMPMWAGLVAGGLRHS